MDMLILKDDFCMCPRCNGTMGIRCNGKMVCYSCDYGDDCIIKGIPGKEFVKKLNDRLNGGIRTGEKEATTMQVSYNGFTGELVKLEREDVTCRRLYLLSIYDREKQVTHSFTGVRMEDVKFLCGKVSFR